MTQSRSPDIKYTCPILCSNLSFPTLRQSYTERAELRPEKISLKGFSSIENPQARTAMFKSHSSAAFESCKDINNIRCSSNMVTKRSSFIKKRGLVQSQIKKINDRMSSLSLVYTAKILQLQHLKRELQKMRKI